MNSTKFIHIADLHLGKRQYNNNERYNDYFRVFKWVLDLAIREKVDFILISGDIFDNRKVEPSVLTEVFYIIRKFKSKCQKQLNRDIHLICIEGNHDNPIYSEQSWMTFLADLDLIILLSGKYDNNLKKIIFNPYDYKTHRGGRIQINNVNIYGLPFYGSSTSHLFQPIREAINTDNSNLNILMMHFGIEGQDPTKSGIKISENLRHLHDRVNYLALGHFHKQYLLPMEEPWIFNPGSLEITDIKEVFKDFTRGAFLVECTGKEFQWKSLKCDNGDVNQDLIPNRKFLGISQIDISNESSFDETIEHVLETLKRWGIQIKNSEMAVDVNDLNYPIVYFNIKGKINYSRLDININRLRQEIMEKFAILEVRIFSPYLISTLDEIRVPNEKKTIGEIENEVFIAIIKENPLFKDMTQEVVELMKNLKAELIARNPNFLTLKNFIKDWCVHNSRVFNIPIDGLKPKLSDPKEVTKNDGEISTIINEEIDDELDLDDYIDDIDNNPEEVD
ncbi:MAG: metallophosphoesterase family protein [Promethearchaeota archaeon]